MILNKLCKKKNCRRYQKCRISCWFQIRWKRFFKREESQTKCYWDIVNVVLMIFTIFACLFKKIQSFCMLLWNSLLQKMWKLSRNPLQGGCSSFSKAICDSESCSERTRKEETREYTHFFRESKYEESDTVRSWKVIFLRLTFYVLWGTPCEGITHHFILLIYSLFSPHWEY